MVHFFVAISFSSKSYFIAGISILSQQTIARKVAVVTHEVMIDGKKNPHTSLSILSPAVDASESVSFRSADFAIFCRLISHYHLHQRIDLKIKKSGK